MARRRAVAPTKAVESTVLRSIAGCSRRTAPKASWRGRGERWHRARADVELIAARQRGFRDDETLRIAQLIDADTLLFMVQRPARCTSTSPPCAAAAQGAGLDPRQEAVAPLEAGEAESNFRREVLYWEQRIGR